jgi:hypothetical protein
MRTTLDVATGAMLLTLLAICFQFGYAMGCQ